MFKKNIDLFIAILLLFFSVFAPNFGLFTVSFLPIRFVLIVTVAISILLIGRRLFLKGKNKNSALLRFVGGCLVGLGLLMLWAYMGTLCYMIQTDSLYANNLSALPS